MDEFKALPASLPTSQPHPSHVPPRITLCHPLPPCSTMAPPSRQPALVLWLLRWCGGTTQQPCIGARGAVVMQHYCIATAWLLGFRCPPIPHFHCLPCLLSLLGFVHAKLLAQVQEDPLQFRLTETKADFNYLAPLKPPVPFTPPPPDAVHAPMFGMIAPVEGGGKNWALNRLEMRRNSLLQ